MRVLVGCEFTQTVCKAFRARGHEAFSCDTYPTEGNPEWHILDDVLNHLNGEWDMAIFHPPCTRLTNAANKWFTGKYARPHYWPERDAAIKFYLALWNAPIEKIAIENPRFSPYAKEKLGEHTQIIQPYQFGITETKAIGLRLKNLPDLIGTNDVYDDMMKLEYKDRAKVHSMGKRKGIDRGRERSRFYCPIAEAMATQWGAI